MEAGCYIVQVVEGGAADQAGLQVNDRIVKFDGQDITSSSEVKAILNEHKIGDTVTMVIERDGKQQEVNITLQSQSQQQLKQICFTVFCIFLYFFLHLNVLYDKNFI